MITTPSKGEIIKQALKEKRESMSNDDRQVAALELLADQSVEIKSLLFQLNATLGLLLRKS